MRSLFLSAAALVMASCGAQTVSSSDAKDFTEFTQAKRLADFSWVTSIFEENYGMLQYKEQRFGFTFPELKAKYQALVGADGVGHEDYDALVQQFVAEMHDAHTSATVLRDGIVEGWEVKVVTLGFTTTREIEGGASLAKVAKVLPKFFPNAEGAPIKAGDEILAIGGKTVAEVLSQDILKYRNLGQDESNLTFAYASLANRFNINFAKLPSGPVDVKVKRDGHELTVKLNWVKTGLDIMAEDTATEGKAPALEILEVRPDGKLLVRQRTDGKLTLDSLNGAAMLPVPFRHEVAYQKEVGLLNYIGATEGGDAPSASADFEAEGLKFKLLNTDKGLTAIYRVEDFMMSRLKCGDAVDVGGGLSISVCTVLSGEDYAKSFGKLKTLGVKALILDLRSNGGGALDWGYELVRAFTRSGVVGNMASVRLNEEWLGDMRAASLATYLPLTVRDGYKKQFDILAADAAAGKTMSSPISITGLNQIYGSTEAWEGKTFVLTDEMCASMCDIFATSMQDHQLATVIGKQSMGAGGNVIGAGMAPHSKIQLSQTASIMFRLDGSAIENEGVKPDVVLASTSGEEFWTAVKAAVETAL